MEPVSVGVVGCGAISDVYFEACERFDALDAVACADLDEDLAESKAEEYGVPRVLSTEELLEDPDVDVIAVLTPPASHGDLLLAALRAGKHAYTEKPLAAAREQGEAVIEAASERELTVGVAPDTVLGTGIQTCRDVLDDGVIGDPVGAVAFWANHGHESWHPNPDGFYREGGGPLFDMGPYYLTSLVTLLGPIQSVAGTSQTPFPEREITSEPRRGERIPVEVPTHETAVLTFESGATGTLLTSFDVWGSELPGFEIHGTEGTLSVTDPNRFDGSPRVHLRDDEEGEWREVSVERSHPGQQRGLGLVDLARSLSSDWEHRTNGEVGYHVLEAMAGIRDSAGEGEYVDLSAGCDRPAPVPDGFPRVDSTSSVGGRRE
ncbi:Gfo/Idh/MocA family protein [Halogeometricum luteum]|uniref:Gfo/Idh/MocA family oxidoreductase n=1 Tax=Halogeometricum luteum TaxID=2950537 RepID=A0ABU2G597_9EURY|nr:Gfo/Idh/MocA family oxidoreductase [Halogeometricum sp. S3BR5-2]MDS0295474.1 Gfo/Idh/MocA family oxidoreductase [Halogeometricum sp. S3BR5-2]